MGKTVTWIEKQKVPFPVLLDPKGTYYESLELPAGPYPIVFLLDAEGRVTWVGDPTRTKKFEHACEARLEAAIRARKEKGAGSEKSGR